MHWGRIRLAAKRPPMTPHCWIALDQASTPPVFQATMTSNSPQRITQVSYLLHRMRAGFLSQFHGENKMQSRVALVTGGTGGSGTSIVKRLASMGHKVATNYRNEEKAKAWQEQMRAEGVEVALAHGDVSS